MKANLIKKGRMLGLIAGVLCGASVVAAPPVTAQVRIGISVGTAPPPLPIYLQPAVPGDDFIWTPGYWAWNDAGYFWVPGAWVLAPEPGMLWTPGYWGWAGSGYAFHRGYWGRHIGYYGGINYGFGYFGTGFVGGGWYGPHFRYNTAVTNVNTTIVRNVYVDRRVIVNNNTTVNRVSYNGGRGGLTVQPTTAQIRVAAHRRPMTAEQVQHEHVASLDRNQLASVNHDHPKQLAVNRPFTDQTHPTSFDKIRPTDRVAPRPRDQHMRPNQMQRPPRPARPVTQARPVPAARPVPQPRVERPPVEQRQERQRQDR